MKTTDYRIDEIKPYKDNTKLHDATQIANVAKSIERYGFVQPIVIDRNGTIIIGHCRYEASKALGLKKVPCVCLEELTEEQVNMLRIVDNKTNESPWDMERLDHELRRLGGEFSEFDLYFDFSGVMDDEPDEGADEPDEGHEPEEEDEPLDEGFVECPRCGHIYKEDDER